MVTVCWPEALRLRRWAYRLREEARMESPVQHFCAAILDGHIATLTTPRMIFLGHRVPRSEVRRRELMEEAQETELQWLLDAECDAPVTFRQCCAVLALDPEVTRNSIMRATGQSIPAERCSSRARAAA